MPSLSLTPTPLTEEFILSIDTAEPLAPALIGKINAFCDRVEDSGDGAVVAIRLTGTGADEQWPGNVGIELVSRWEKALRRLERIQASTIAVVEGVCSGPALEVLLTADHRIGATGMVIKTPVSNGSIWAGMIVHRLANQLGAARARQLLLFGAEIGAERALSVGLVDEIVDEPLATAAERAGIFAGLSVSELAIRRRLILDASATSFEEALGMHLAACDRSLRRAGDTDAASARQ